MYEFNCATTEMRKITHWEEDTEEGVAVVIDMGCKGGGF